MFNPVSWLHPAFDLAGNLLSPAGTRARLSILIYHRVRETVDNLRTGELDRHGFDWQMGLLARHFHVLPLSEACKRLAQGSLPARAACITFDDGYADNESVALPILYRHGLTATFFVATQFLNGGRMWNDTVIEWVRRVNAEELDLSDFGLGVVRPTDIQSRRDMIKGIIAAIKYLEPEARAARVSSLVERAPVSLPTNLMMTTVQLRNLAQAGMEIGGHTHSHPILASLDDVRARREIEAGKGYLEEITGVPVRLFAYPNGKPGTDYRRRDRDLVKSLGFEAAVSTQWGAADRDSDLFQLPRFTPWHGSAHRFHLALLRNYGRQGLTKRQAVA